MWLLNTKTLKLESFEGQKPPYAILSHRWEEQEVPFEEIQNRQGRNKKGYEKIQRCCHRSLKDGYEYAWIDTCCIDKRSSAELSEAINSMYKWYRNAEVCYAFLSDIGSGVEDHAEFTRSLWFTRGWTLQELLAPRRLLFYDAFWKLIGSRRERAGQIGTHTGIRDVILSGADDSEIHKVSVAERMTWAAGRQTTREEDRAYSLLGIFGVNMPLLYGEGARAFFRLQVEIAHFTGDLSLLAWSGGPSRFSSTFAASPDSYEKQQFDYFTSRQSNLSISGTLLNGRFLLWHHVFNIYFAMVATPKIGVPNLGLGIFLEFDLDKDCFQRVALDQKLLVEMKSRCASDLWEDRVINIMKSSEGNIKEASSSYYYYITPAALRLTPGIIFKERYVKDNYYDTHPRSKTGTNLPSKPFSRPFMSSYHSEWLLDVPPTDCISITSWLGLISPPLLINFGKTMDDRWTLLVSKIQAGPERRHLEARVNTHACCEIGCATLLPQPKPNRIDFMKSKQPEHIKFPDKYRVFRVLGLGTFFVGTSNDGGLCARLRLENGLGSIEECLPEDWLMTAEDEKLLEGGEESEHSLHD